MDPTKGEAVQQTLWAFLERTVNEAKPSNEGWVLFHELEKAVNELGDDYESLAPRVPTPKVASPPAVQQADDNWFVEIFDRVNGDTWNRHAGDRLTLRQKIDIAGQTFLMAILISFIVVGSAYLVIHLQEWQIGRYR